MNAGSDGWNYQVRDLAAAVSKAIPNVEISINPMLSLISAPIA